MGVKPSFVQRTVASHFAAAHVSECRQASSSTAQNRPQLVALASLQLFQYRDNAHSTDSIGDSISGALLAAKLFRRYVSDNDLNGITAALFEEPERKSLFRLRSQRFRQ